MRTLPQCLCATLLLGPVFTTAAHSTVYGSDDRTRPEALLDAADERRYMATQLVWCAPKRAKPRGAAGNLATDFTHGVTISHLFEAQESGPMTHLEDCTFRVYDRKGKLLDEVAIVRLRSLWREVGPRLDSDLAMFELARRPKAIDTVLSLGPTPVQAGQEIMLVAFHYDVEPVFTKRKTHGRVYSTLGTQAEGIENLFHTDVDCVPMSSGGPIYDAQGRVIALIRGSSSRGDSGPRVFDELRDHNQAIRFNAKFLREYAEFVNGR